MFCAGAKRLLQENPGDQVFARILALRLEADGARWEELIEMLQHFGMDLVVVNKKTLMPFAATDVRIDISWYVNLFASRGGREIRGSPDHVRSLPQATRPGFLGNRLE